MDTYGYGSTNTTDATKMTVSAIPIYKSSLVKGLSNVSVLFSNGNACLLYNKSISGKPGLYEKTEIKSKAEDSIGGYDNRLAPLPHYANSSLRYRGMPLSGYAKYNIMAGAGLLKTIESALQSSCSVSISPRNLTFGQTVGISYNFSGVLSYLKNISITIYSPMMGSIVRSAYIGTSATGTYSYEITQGSVYGPYPVKIEASLLVSGTSVTARLIDYFVVTLPDGSQPSSPAYDVQLVMWYPEW